MALGLSAPRWKRFGEWPQSRNGRSHSPGLADRNGAACSLPAVEERPSASAIFLSGINEDRLGESYKTYQPGRGFLEVPVWLSSGANDPIATPQAHNLVKASLERTGFKRVRLEQFGGGHQLKMSEVRRALQWFRQLGRF
jgi:predicted esterase